MDELTYHRLLLQTREQRPDNIVFVEGGVPVSVAEHVDGTLQLVQALRRAGVAPGERIAVLADASSRFVGVLHAAAMGGWIAVPLNIRLASPELAALLRDCTPRLVFVDPAHHAALMRALGQLDQVPQVVLLDHEPAGAEPVDEEWSMSELVAGEIPTEPAEPPEDRALLMLYTGGTTGRSRGAVCDNRQLVLSLHRLQVQLDYLAAGSTMISMNPLFHIGAINAAYAFPSAGSTVVFHPTFEPGRVIDDAAPHGVTHLSAVVAILQRLMGHQRFDPERFPALRYVTYGANPIPADLLTQVLRAFPQVQVQQSYGMTEAFGGVTCLSGDDHVAGGPRLASVGQALPGVRVTVRDAAGREVPRNDAGEVCITSGSVTTRYWGVSAQPEDALELHTGDIGRLDEEGFLYLLDRAKDMIKTGGENVYSVEVEAVLQRHPGVEAVAVIGLPDPTWGERVHAVVVCTTEPAVNAEQLRDFAREHLAPFKVPKTVDVRSSPLPTSSIGKVLKRELREECRR